MSPMDSLTALFKPSPKPDVFLSTKRQIESTMSSTDTFVSQYKSKFCKAEDRVVLAKQIEINIKVVEDLLASLSSTVDSKENSADTQAKRTFLATSRSKIIVYKNAIQSQTSNTPSSNNESKRSLMEPAKPRKNFIETPVYTNSDEQVLLALQDQKKAMAEQDELLDALLPSIEQLKHISRAMHTELELQNNLLTKLDTEVDKASIKLNQTNKRTTKLLRQI